MSKQVVLLSTYTIESKDNSRLLSYKKVTASLFISPLLYRYFISRVSANDKENLYSKLKIKKEEEDDNAIDSFLALYGLKDTPKLKIKGDLRKLNDNGKALKQYEELKSGYSVDKFVEAVQPKSIEELNNIFAGVPAPNIMYSNGRCKGNSFADRFSLYTLNNLATINEDDCVVYAVWPLSQQAVPREDWLEALCDEVLERHKDDNIEIILGLHGKDLYSKKSFDVEECYVCKENRLGRRYIRSCFVFEHGADAFNYNIISKSLSPEMVVAECHKLMNLENVLDTTKEENLTLAELRDMNDRLKEIGYDSI